MSGFDGAIAMSPIDETGYVVEDRRPGRAVVDGLPDAAGREADIDDRRIALDDRDVVDAAADVGRADSRQTNVLSSGSVDALIGGGSGGAGWGRLASMPRRRDARQHSRQPSHATCARSRTNRRLELRPHLARSSGVQGSAALLLEVHLRRRLRFRRRLEERIFLEAEHLRGQVRRELPPLRVVVLHRSL